MTREEAKAWFKVLLKDEYAFNSADREAFAMAIKALEQEPCDVFDEYGDYKYPSDVELTEPNTATSMPCKDAINRKDTIDWLKRVTKTDGITFETGFKQILHDIEQMPSVEPVNPQPCEDAISREDALMALTGEWTEITDEIIHCFIKRIKALPPVNPQPKTGHWIFDEILDKHYYCSECKSMGVDYWDFCPYCGAKMIELQESENK